MDIDKNTIEKEFPDVIDYIFYVDKFNDIGEICKNFLKHPLFKDITEADEIIIINQFTDIEKKDNKFPGFIFIKIDITTSIVYVNYIDKELLINFKPA